MQFTVNLGVDQLINFIKQLPASQIIRIKSEINKKNIKKNIKNEKTEFQKFLLNGPVMSDQQYEFFKENRKKMKQWRSQ